MVSQHHRSKAASQPNAHDQLMERAWQNCRAGLAICRQNEWARQKTLEFSARARAVAPTHIQRWIEILKGGHVEHVAKLFDTEHFFDLPLSEQAWWDQLVQSAPFAAIWGPLRQEKAKNKGHIANKTRRTGMTLEQFDHICRAAAAVAGVKRIYAFGANAIIPWLAQSGHPIPLSDFIPSRELDVSVGDEKLDTLIDGSIGELSPFDETFAVYAHSVSLASFQAPANWQKRVGRRIEPISGVKIVVPHPHDLIISKLVAGRPKDFDFAVSAARLFAISKPRLTQLLDEFREAYPEKETQLRKNVEIWKQKMSVVK